MLSKEGNDQHHPGKPLHWDRSKSGDEMDALCRHAIGNHQALGIDDKIIEARAVAWRAMANLQKMCERREDEKRNLQKSAQERLALDQARFTAYKADADENRFVDLDVRHPHGNTPRDKA